ncbi:MAG: hypothetical protein ACR2FN_10720 [Chitinophagaceae bacterium]
MIESDSSKIIYLTIDDFREITNSIIEFNAVFSEDIPPFETRYFGKLETIIEQVQTNYFGVEFYQDLVSKAAILFYLIIKNLRMMKLYLLKLMKQI